MDRCLHTKIKPIKFPMQINASMTLKDLGDKHLLSAQIHSLFSAVLLLI